MTSPTEQGHGQNPQESSIFRQVRELLGREEDPDDRSLSEQPSPDTFEPSPHELQRHLVTLYQHLVDYLKGKGVMRVGLKDAPDQFHQVHLRQLGNMTVKFIKPEGVDGILLTQMGSDGTPAERWNLFETGNASVFVYGQGQTDKTSVRTGRVQIVRVTGKKHIHNLNPSFVYSEFQRVAADIGSNAFHHVTPS